MADPVPEPGEWDRTLDEHQTDFGATIAPCSEIGVTT